MDETYHTHEVVISFLLLSHALVQASSLYGMLIGRNLPFTTIKSEFMESDVVKKGYLMKRGSWIKSWCVIPPYALRFFLTSNRKRRFFILRSDIRELCYYVSEEQLTLIGSIAIDANTIVWNVREKDSGANPLMYNPSGFVDPANANSFVVRWHAPPNSGKTNREVMLKSDDVITMNEWLDAISSEALRTEEVKQVDWWADLFGKVFRFFFSIFHTMQINSLDSKAIRESIRHRNSSLPRMMLSSHSLRIVETGNRNGN